MPDSMLHEAQSVPDQQVETQRFVYVLKAVLVNVVTLFACPFLLRAVLDSALRTHPAPAIAATTVYDSYFRYDAVTFLLLIAAFLLCVALNGVLHAGILRLTAGRGVRLTFLLADFTVTAPGAVLSRGRYLTAVLLPSALLIPASLWLVGPATLWLQNAGMPPWTLLLPCLLPAQAITNLVNVLFLILWGVRQSEGIRFAGEESAMAAPSSIHAKVEIEATFAGWFAATTACYQANAWVWRAQGAFVVICGTVIFLPLYFVTAQSYYWFFTPGQMFIFLMWVALAVLLLMLAHAGMVHTAAKQLYGRPTKFLDLFAFVPRLGQLIAVWKAPLFLGAAPCLVSGIFMKYYSWDPENAHGMDLFEFIWYLIAMIVGIITLVVICRFFPRSFFAIPELCRETLPIDAVFFGGEWMKSHRQGLWRYLGALLGRAHKTACLWSALIAPPTGYLVFQAFEPMNSITALFCVVLILLISGLIGILYGLPWLAIGQAVAYEAPAIAVSVPRARMSWPGRLLTVILFAAVLYPLYSLVVLLVNGFVAIYLTP